MRKSNGHLGRLTGNRTSLYCIIGMPAHHSLSPAMHNAMFSKLGMDSIFLAFDVPKEKLEEAIQGMRAYDIKGMTLTSPHKEKALKLVDYVDKYAEELGAVNTIANKNGKLYGYNTDEPGFVRSIEHYAREKDKRYLIIGAGGAARAFAFGLVRYLGASNIKIINRTLAHAKSLSRDLAARTGVKAEVAKLGSEKANRFVKSSEFIINATNITLENSTKTPIGKDLLDKDKIVFDANYVPLENRLIKEAREKGCITISGIELLVNQGIEAFRLFTGRKADYKTMKEAAMKNIAMR